MYVFVVLVGTFMYWLCVRSMLCASPPLPHTCMHAPQLTDGDRILEDDRSLQTGYIFVYCAVPPT